MLPIYINSFNDDQQTVAVSSSSSFQDEMKPLLPVSSFPPSLSNSIRSLSSTGSLSSTSSSSTTSSASSSNNSKWNEDGSTSLGTNFTPGPYDVICGRGKTSYNHSGNRYFRELVSKYATKYSNAPSRSERSAIVSNIVDTIRRMSGNNNGGFVKQDESTSEWIEVGDTLAREKIGQMLRNALSTKYRSSMASKTKRRRQTQIKKVQLLHNVMQSNIDIKLATDQIQQTASRAKANSKSSTLSDEQLLDLFTQQQSNMLSSIQSNTNLVDEFVQAEVTAALVMDTTDNDESSIIVGYNL